VDLASIIVSAHTEAALRPGRRPCCPPVPPRRSSAAGFSGHRGERWSRAEGAVRVVITSGVADQEADAPLPPGIRRGSIRGVLPSIKDSSRARPPLPSPRVGDDEVSVRADRRDPVVNCASWKVTAGDVRFGSPQLPHYGLDVV
jgi:hypothetical protein